MIRLALARLTRGLRWSNPRRAALLYMAFARAERSSHYDLLAAATDSPDPARRALYLRHASDESRHALMFALRAAELDPEVAADPRERYADYEQLFERLGELEFLAFVHAGERRGRRQLALYREELAELGDDKGRALLDAVLADEARHEAYTRESLLALCGSERGLRRALWRARTWELGRAALRAGRRVSALGWGLAMRGLYCALFPWALYERRRWNASQQEGGKTGSQNL